MTPELRIEDVSDLSAGVSLSEMSLFSIAVSLKRIADALVNGVWTASEITAANRKALELYEILHQSEKP